MSQREGSYELKLESDIYTEGSGKGEIMFEKRKLAETV